MEVVRAGENFDFDTHEINRQIAPVDFRKAHRIFLCGDDRERLAFFAAVDGV